MALIKINNGFHNATGSEILLAGTMINGNVRPGDKLILENQQEITVLKVETDDIFPDRKNVVILVKEQLGIKWHALFGKTFECKSGPAI